MSDERRERYFTKVEAATGSTRPCATVRVRPARPRARSAVLEARSRELPQRAHLLRPGAAEAGPPDVPLRAEPAGLSPARPHARTSPASASCSRRSTRRTRSSRGRRCRSTLRFAPRTEAHPAADAQAVSDRGAGAPRGADRRRQATSIACSSPATRRRASSSTSRWRSSSFAARPGAYLAAGAGRAAEQPHQDGARRAARPRCARRIAQAKKEHGAGAAPRASRSTRTGSRGRATSW